MHKSQQLSLLLSLMLISACDGATLQHLRSAKARDGNEDSLADRIAKLKGQRGLRSTDMTVTKNGHSIAHYPTLYRIVLMNGDRFADRDCSRDYDNMVSDCEIRVYPIDKTFSIVTVEPDSWQYQELWEGYEAGGRY